MTYGEAHVAEQLSITLEKGMWKKTLNIKDKPDRMSRKDAAKYYNKKLFDHWVNDYAYDDRVSIMMRKSIVSSLMFGHKDRYKEFEEST